MRYFILGIVTFLGIQTVNSQIHEVGLFVGGSNYIGDVGATDYIAPNKLAISAIYKWNKTARYSYRATLSYAKIMGDDSKSDIPSRVARDYQFENTVRAISVGVEYNFFDFNLHELETVVSPYLHSGVTYFNYSALHSDESISSYDIHYAFAIPITVGIKTNISPHFVLGAEVNANYTFSDNLDGSNPKNTPFSDLAFGNTNSTDWYVFSGITLTYTFGRKPCYCPY